MGPAGKSPSIVRFYAGICHKVKYCTYTRSHTHIHTHKLTCKFKYVQRNDCVAANNNASNAHWHCKRYARLWLCRCRKMLWHACHLYIYMHIYTYVKFYGMWILLYSLFCSLTVIVKLYMWELERLHICNQMWCYINARLCSVCMW